jgi:lipoate-protein ligase B
MIFGFVNLCNVFQLELKITTNGIILNIAMELKFYRHTRPCTIRASETLLKDLCFDDGSKEKT